MKPQSGSLSRPGANGNQPVDDSGIVHGGWCCIRGWLIPLICCGDPVLVLYKQGRFLVTYMPKRTAGRGFVRAKGQAACYPSVAPDLGGVETMRTSARPHRRAFFVGIQHCRTAAFSALTSERNAY
jgi:hypothetical protein